MEALGQVIAIRPEFRPPAIAQRRVSQGLRHISKPGNKVIRRIKVNGKWEIKWGVRDGQSSTH